MEGAGAEAGGGAQDGAQAGAKEGVQAVAQNRLPKGCECGNAPVGHWAAVPEEDVDLVAT